MACSSIDGPETLRRAAAALLGSIDCRDENDVTLVTLYIFEVLHEKGFERTFPTFTVTLGVIIWLFFRAAREVEQRQRLLDLADTMGFPLDERRAARAVAAGQGQLLEERIRGRR